VHTFNNYTYSELTDHIYTGEINCKVLTKTLRSKLQQQKNSVMVAWKIQVYSQETLGTNFSLRSTPSHSLSESLLSNTLSERQYISSHLNAKLNSIVLHSVRNVLIKRKEGQGRW